MTDPAAPVQDGMGLAEVLFQAVVHEFVHQSSLDRHGSGVLDRSRCDRIVLPAVQTWLKGRLAAAEVVEAVAYMLWQFNQGYILAEDRAVGENWMRDDPATMHPDDAAELPGWLDAARAAIAAVADVLGGQG